MCDMTWHMPSSVSGRKGGKSPTSTHHERLVNNTHHQIFVFWWDRNFDSNAPAKRSHACISSWAKIDPVSNLQNQPPSVIRQVAKLSSMLQLENKKCVSEESPREAIEDQDGCDFTTSNQFLRLESHWIWWSWVPTKHLHHGIFVKNDIYFADCWHSRCKERQLTVVIVCSSDRQSPRVSAVCVPCREIITRISYPPSALFTLLQLLQVLKCSIVWNVSTGIAPLSRPHGPRWGRSEQPRAWELPGQSACRHSCRIWESRGTGVGISWCPPRPFLNTRDTAYVHLPMSNTATSHSAILMLSVFHSIT